MLTWCTRISSRGMQRPYSLQVSYLSQKECCQTTGHPYDQRVDKVHWHLRGLDSDCERKEEAEEVPRRKHDAPGQVRVGSLARQVQNKRSKFSCEPGNMKAAACHCSGQWSPLAWQPTRRLGVSRRRRPETEPDPCSEVPQVSPQSSALSDWHSCDAPVTVPA